jgi:hypothetical protein
VLLLTAYYPRRSQKSMGARGKEKSSFSLTKFTDTNSYIEIYKNQIIKMREKFRILEYILISLLRSLFFINYIIVILGYLWVVSSLGIDPALLCALIPIKIYDNAEVEKGKILTDNKYKSGIYM